MPELPEVESTARFVNERIVGLQIIGVQVLWDRSIGRPAVTKFKEEIIGCTVKSVTRRGKFVVVNLLGPNNLEKSLFIHLRMSGQLDVVPETIPLEKHDRVNMVLSNGKALRFNDVRKFGKMYLPDSAGEITDALGMEPLSEEFSADALYRGLQATRRVMKSALLDQGFIAGIGNIYADEALHRARIHPTLPANRVTYPQATSLHREIISVLSEAIELSGTDFGDGVVYGGMFTPKVYGRTGKGCLTCARKIVRIVVGQRSTHYCVTCQTKRPARILIKRPKS